MLQATEEIGVDSLSPF